MSDFEAPDVSELSMFAGLGPSLRAQQQQQQQQQQKKAAAVRRFIDPETQLPTEEIVQQLTTELKQTNKIVPSDS